MINPYLPYIATIKKIKIESVAKDTKTFDVVIDDGNAKANFKHRPGQFAELSVFGYGEAPISITSSPTQKEALQFCVKKMGVVTGALHSLSEGDKIGIRGPYGNVFPIDMMKGKNIVFVAGGIGLAPLRSLINYMLDENNRKDFKDITIIYGARSPGDLLFKYELAEWEKRPDLTYHVTVDKGDDNWQGKVGFVPTLLKEVTPKSKDTVALTCGPPIMIKFVLKDLLDLGFKDEDIITTLEMRMKCGIGKCGRCNIGRVYVCRDGPVFSLAQLNQMPMEY
jgi:sulfite reductase subunit B